MDTPNNHSIVHGDQTRAMLRYLALFATVDCGRLLTHVLSPQVLFGLKLQSLVQVDKVKTYGKQSPSDLICLVHSCIELTSVYGILYPVTMLLLSKIHVHIHHIALTANALWAEILSRTKEVASPSAIL